MKTISLAKAFRIRNKLKEKVTQKMSDWNYTPKSWPENMSPSYKRSDGRSAKQVIDDFEWLENVLLSLNIAINYANQKQAQAINLRINSINDRMRFLEMAYEEVLRQPDIKEDTNRVTGVTNITKMETAIQNPNEIKSIIDHLKNTKFDLETKLSELNATTQVDVSINCQDTVRPLCDELTDILGLDL